MTEFAKRRSWGPSPRYENVEKYVHPRSGFTVIAGPCSVENEFQIWQVASLVSKYATHLRGGVFRAGTYPGANFGWIDPKLMASYKAAAKHHKLKNIVEVLDYRDLDVLDPLADCYQVGCRQMQNYTLLRLLGTTGKPVFLKRHPGSTIDEFLGAAEHALVGGVKELYLIERGSSSNATHCRWDLSVSMIPAVKAITKIPIIGDASHGTGRRDLVGKMTLACVAAGANGILVETHPDPEKSLSDHDQAISFKQFEDLMYRVEYLRKTLGELPDEMPGL
jgi:3-deoxy-7-phosphoheptulonate synthase